jgi:hypothetical protein
MAKRCRSCCGGTCTLTVTIRGCNLLPLPGAAVEVRQFGTLVGSGTTNSGGVAVFSIPQFSVSAVTISKARFVTSASNPVTTTGATASFTPNPMTAAAGYACQGSTCASRVAGPRTCPDPLKTSLVLTLDSGTITLTGGPNWNATEDRGGIRFKYSSDGCGLTYGWCTLGNPGDPTCVNAASYTAPTAYAEDYPIACPPSFLCTGTLTSPYNSGAWSIVEPP